MNDKRLNRVSEEVKKVISSLIINGLKDPRIDSLTSVVDVDITNDLRYAYIYISVLGDENSKQNTLHGLNSAKGFIRREIGRKVDLRYIPEPIFKLDQSIEHGVYMSNLIAKVNEEDKKKKSDINE